MNLTALFAAATLTATLAACGGGGGVAQDIRPGDAPRTVAQGIDRFLLFPNPQLQDDGRLQTDTAAYAQAYYDAVDPDNDKTTLAAWRNANGFGSGSGEEVSAVFGDVRDLGYGRRMTGRRNADGTLAFMVENYLAGGYGDVPLSTEAAVLEDKRWLVGINAIEFSPAPDGGVPFAKFFNFNARTGARELMVDLDGRGAKAMPGVCVSCHGGRADALVPDAGGTLRYAAAKNSASGAAGDALGKLHAFEVDSFAFATRAGFTRADQEAALKRLNQFVLCTYPSPTGPTPVPGVDCLRRPAVIGEWQGSSAALITAAYGGDAMTAERYTDTYLPGTWLTSGQATLYRDVVAPSCRACHLLRGTDQQAAIAFDRFEDFASYRDRLRAHLVDRGNMPLARIVYESYWSSDAPDAMARFLETPELVLRDAVGKPLQPGRPVADPGPARRATINEQLLLSGRNSLHAERYAWTFVSGTSGPGALSAADQSVAELRPTAPGEHVLRLVVSRGSEQSAPVDVRVFVNAASPAVNLAAVKALLVSSCVSCHAAGNPTTPVSFARADYPSEAGLHAAIRSRINLTDIAASALLRKPAGHQHGGLAIPFFDDAADAGSPERSGYDLVLDWALAGAR